MGSDAIRFVLQRGAPDSGDWMGADLLRPRMSGYREWWIRRSLTFLVFMICLIKESHCSWEEKSQNGEQVH
jgi:hypothetical protein